MEYSCLRLQLYCNYIVRSCNYVEQLGLTLTQKRVLLGHPDGFSNEDYRKLSNFILTGTMLTGKFKN